MALFNFFSKNKKESLDKGLEKTKQSFLTKIARSVVGKSKVDADVLDNLEEILITSDVGVETTLKIIEKIESRVARDKVLGVEELNTVLKEEISSLLEENNAISNVDFSIPKHDEGPHVIMVVGVNGVGKTTTIGKVAKEYIDKGKKVLMVAGDTFRAGAINQLRIWSERVGSEFFSKDEGSDPSSVMFDAINYAKENDIDIILCDTAGRLQNKVNLMKELDKIHRVISREVEEAPHETLLVIDATTGQNGLSQAKIFNEVSNISGIVLTKLDGTAKGGIVLAIKEELGIPIKYVGLGEKVTDLEHFDIEEYLYGMFGDIF